MSRNPNWTEEEDILALCLYYELPYGQHDKNNSKVKELSAILGRRTPDSVAMKLNNFKSFDTAYSGDALGHASSTDKRVWELFINKPALLFETRKRILGSMYSEEISDKGRAAVYLTDSEMEKLVNEIDFSEEDNTRMQAWRERQWAFRLSLFRGYESQCCLSGVSAPDFLIASHIVPWNKDKENRLNPRNGLLLNVFLDKAFDKGYISIRKEDYTVMVCPDIKDTGIRQQLLRYEGCKIRLPRNPERWPDKQFLEYHNNMIFRRRVNVNFSAEV